MGWEVFWAAVGVVLAVLYPLLVGAVRKAFPQTAGREWIPEWARQYAKRYGLLFIFGAVTGLLVVALFHANNANAHLEWYQALALGLGGESAVEKAFRKPVGFE